MKKEYYNVIGVMSGTSLDGVDLAHIEFEIIDQKWTFKIHESETICYTPNWVGTLQTALTFSKLELEKLNHDYTALLAHIITEFITKHNIENLDAIASHGHTIVHQPENGITLQIGNLPEIATLTKQNVVCDFRVQDVALGGQGAPLVPIGDQILFSEYDYCMNLGGFSNVSFIQNKKQIAFDICPVNTVLNFYANKLGLNYDDKGTLSKTGICNIGLLKQLNDLSFYKLRYPKSLGLEFVNQKIIPIIESYPISIEDKLSTFTAHISMQIAGALAEKKGKLLLTGGGAYNDFLIASIAQHLPEITLIIPENKIVEFKEALIFALLGVLKLREEINVLSSVTGAKSDHSSGVVYSYKKTSKSF